MRTSRCPLLLLTGIFLLSGLLGGAGGEGMEPAHAEEAERGPAAHVPILYEVETKPRIYLLGTIHAGDPRLTQHPAVLRRALGACAALYTELAFEPEEFKAGAALVFLPKGESLRNVLPPPLYARAAALFAQRNIDLKTLDTFKIWALWLQAQGLGAPLGEARATPQVPMDVLLYRSAKQAGKVVGGLETMAEQVQIFDALSRKQQLRLLEDALDSVESARRSGEDRVAALIQTYLRGDPDAVLRSMFSHVDLSDSFNREIYVTRLLDQRNVRMVRRMLTKAQTHPEKPTLVAVGAGHLPGPKGILALLRQTGFRVRKLETLADLQRPWPGTTPAAPARPRRRYRRIGPFCVPVGWRRPRCASPTTSAPSGAWPPPRGAPSSTGDPRRARRSHR